MYQWRGKNHEQATPAATKDNVSVRGTDTEKTHAQAGPVARTSDVSMPGIDTEKIHAQDGPAAITRKVSVPGTDTTKSHAQSDTDATTSGGYMQGTDADKINELDQGFSSQAMDFVHERQAVVHFVQDAIAASADRQKLNADNNGRGPFTVTERHGSAYTLELPSDMRLHPTFYVVLGD
ncbi:hypothetical protein PHMEG_00035024 [Phytophthora megakarya]|uniref:Uncharacterized protein n=1 Tax=Phytophthora megakarya TaxID=4795 RepID=A0A225UR91_9STRA|nr:hypothetical protein PHMEG_00035024 [Phytophthora megakarya]